MSGAERATSPVDPVGSVRAVGSVPRTMRAAVLLAAHRIEVQERPVPAPRTGEVLVQVRSVGVCGSDVHYYREGRIGPYVVDRPLVLGHEASGVVAAVGPGVAPDRIGERVSIEPQRPCRRCAACKAGRYNLCPRMEFFGTPPVDGAFCEYVVVPSDFAHAVPDALSDDVAALLEPLSVALWACRKAGVGLGSRVLVTGAGPVGALTCVAAAAAGAVEVVATDLVPYRRDRVLAFGAALALDPGDPGSAVEDLQGEAHRVCRGAASATVAGLRALRESGTAVLVGLGADTLELPVNLIASRELVLTGVFRYAGTWPTAVALAQRSAADLDSLVTGRFGLDDVEQALAVDDPHSMKSVVVLSRT